MFDLNYGAISAIESGRSTPTTDLVMKLSQLFNVSTDYILMGTEESSTISHDEQELINLYREDGQIRDAWKDALELKKKAINRLSNLTANDSREG